MVFQNADVVFSYPEQQAIDDGVLCQLVMPDGKKTPWLCSAAVWTNFENNNGNVVDVGRAAMNRFRAMVLDLAGAESARLMDKNETLISDGKWVADTGYWVRRNGMGGWTIMKPSDY